MQQGNVEKFLCKMLHIEYGNYYYFVTTLRVLQENLTSRKYKGTMQAL